MDRAAVLDGYQEFYCPNCAASEAVPLGQVRPGDGQARLHTCRGLRGLLAPMIQVGVRCKVESREWDEYVGNEIATRDGEGRPIMSVVTTRDDGSDAVVFPACATARLEDYR